ncbi:MAG: Ig-like domain-containing protein, partial [Gemmataceae bacterium]
PVTLTANVTDPAAVKRVPTGTVTFFADGVEIGTGRLTANGTGRAKATLTTGSLSLGSPTITVQYSGDGLFALKASAPITQVVQPLGTRTSTTSLARTPATTVAGQAVTLTATVSDTGSGGAVAPTGVVSFFDGPTLLGTGTLTLVGGVHRATFTTGALSVGSHSLTAVYGGNLTFAQGGAAAATHVVNQASTTTVLAATAAAVTGQAVTFTATVKPVLPGAGTPTGAVRFKVNGVEMTEEVTYTMANGALTARITTTSLTAGSYQITADFAGDAQFRASVTTLTRVQTVAAPRTRITATYSTLVANTPMLVTATVSVIAPGSGVPTGSVGVFWDGVLLGNANVDANGQILFEIPAARMTARTHTIRLAYSGDFNFQASSLTQSLLVSNGRQS